MQRLIIFSLLLITISCSRSDEEYFTKTVFIPDSVNTALPKYSELGLNTFGAYYNDLAWMVNKDDNYNTYIVRWRDSTVITFNGSLQQNRLDLSVIMKPVVNDLLYLNNKTFSLPSNDISFMINGMPAIVNAGSFNFKRCRRLLIDTTQIGIILAGTFEIKGLIDTTHFTFKNGRFDLFCQLR